MYRVYECELSKKADIVKVVETDPYAEDSFARVGYKIKDGAIIEEDKTKAYVYIKAPEDFLKKADIKFRGIAHPAPEQIQKRVAEKIVKEEEEAESGFGTIFGEGGHYG